MYKLGELMLITGVLLFMIGGLSIFLNMIPKNSMIISPISILALIFIGSGLSIKKKYKR